MIMLAVLALVVVFGIAYGVSRRGSPDRVMNPAAPIEVRKAGLQRWVDAGLISDDQARAITAFELAQQGTRPKSRVSPAIEALAYVGGVLLAVGAGMLVGQHWDELGTAGHLGVVAVAAVVSGVVGTVVGESDPAAWRLRGFLWALSAAAIGAVAGLFAFEVLEVSGEPVALATAGVAAIAAGGYWQLRDRPLQHALAFLGIAVSIGVAIAWAGAGNVAGFIGLALWLFGGAWAWLAWQRRVPPAIVGFPLGIVLTLVASGIVGGQVEWLAPLLGFATATAWVGAGVVSNERLSLAPGVVGVFVFLPWTLGYFFGETLGAPAIAMLSGALLLGVVVLLLRRGRGSVSGRARDGHFHPVGHP
jgi:uncharacterized membrane protein